MAWWQQLDTKSLESTPSVGYQAPRNVRDSSRNAPALQLLRLGAYSMLSVHLAFTIFMLLTPLLIITGDTLFEWHWIYNPIFRNVHLGFLIFVSLEAVFDYPCPLMTWENAFRRRAGMPMYTNGFFDYWVVRFLGFSLKPWMFNSILGGLGVLSVLVYVLVPPGF